MGRERPAGRRLCLCAGSKGRAADCPSRRFSGILQIGGYGGYRVLAHKSGATLAFCWAHVRRRFYELAAAGPAPIASEALRRIAELYRVEDEIRGQPADARHAVRQERSQPILAELEPWLLEKLGLISQKTKLAEAIRYTLSRREGLSRFLDGPHRARLQYRRAVDPPDRAQPKERPLRGP